MQNRSGSRSNFDRRNIGPIRRSATVLLVAGLFGLAVVQSHGATKLVTSASSATVSSSAAADTFASSLYPRDNRGTWTTLKVSANPNKNTYVRFDVTVPAGAIVQDAVLTLSVTSVSGGGVQLIVQKTSNGWDPHTLDYANAPATGGVITQTANAVAGSGPVSLDVTSAVTGGTASFVISGRGNGEVFMNSSRAPSGGPKLAVTTTVPPVSTPTPTPTTTPTLTPTPTATPSATPSPAPSGNPVDIYAFTGDANATATVASLPGVVDGVSWVFTWKDIEPSPGVFNWKNVDAAIAASSSSGRKTILRVLGGAYSPSWVPNQLTFSFQPLGPGSFQTVTMPRTWDPTYVSDWTAFIAAYGARYDGDSRVTMIQMAGGGYQGEMTLPQWSGWIGAGYTDALMTSAWDTFIDAYRAAFPKHPTVLDFGEPLQVYAQSQIVPAVLAHAETYGSWVRYQQNGLRSGLSQASSIFKTVLALSSSTTVGWQMWGGGSLSGDIMTCFNTAIASHAGYIEVYLNQAVDPADLAALTYLANGG
jgi:hypothetical protein